MRKDRVAHPPVTEHSSERRATGTDDDRTQEETRSWPRA
ncbi:hypothetical protein FH063_005598 [Azospirillum argentinense]|uniref:Uncharacterized protein n=1 Tax=Azospirillum argentinense TaxID=2970906 RepID=A0A5B0KT08_9PROT|nr:hypothetical protein FH063_005598 [Azospirillum argentinense]